jgi:hypothetical protein
MPNSSVFIFLMLRALYRMICKSSKKYFSKKSLNVPNVKLLSISFSSFWAFLCLFGEDDSFHFTCKPVARGGAGGLWPPQFLAKQLTLSQPGGQIMPTTVLQAPPDFQTLRRPCGLLVSLEQTYVEVGQEIH